MVKSERWINMANGGKEFYQRIGVVFSEQHKNNLRKPKTSTKKWTESRKEKFRRPKTQEHADNIKRSFTEEVKTAIAQRVSQSIWIHNGLESKRIHRDDIILDGWFKGRHRVGTKGQKRSLDFCEKIREKRKYQIMKSGWFWVNNGIQNQRCYTNIPEGFKRGLIHGKSAQNKRK